MADFKPCRFKPIKALSQLKQSNFVINQWRSFEIETQRKFPQLKKKQRQKLGVSFKWALSAKS